MEDTNSIKEMLTGLGLERYVTRSQAAALAVICADIRECLEGADEENVKTEAFLFTLEKIAIDSIYAHDGRTTFWVGRAAKQLNPLLCKS